MIRVRRFVSTVALSAALAVAVAGCHKKVPAARAGRRRRRRRPQRQRLHRPPPPPPPPPPAPAPRPLTEEEMFARKSVDQLNAEQPLDDVFFDLDESDVRDDAKPALQKDADWMKKWASVAGDARGPLRLARQRRVQPRARQPARDGGEGLPGQPRRPGRPRHRGQQGQGAAVLQRRERVVLAAEPPRAFRHYRQVAARAGRA